MRPTTLAELTLNRTGLLLFFWIVESLYSYLNNFVFFFYNVFSIIYLMYSITLLTLLSTNHIF